MLPHPHPITVSFKYFNTLYVHARVHLRKAVIVVVDTSAKKRLSASLHSLRPLYSRSFFHRATACVP